MGPGSINIFWLIAVAMAAFIALILLTGRVRIRGQLLADRDEDPKRFWFYLIMFAAVLIIIIVEAISPPY